MKLQSLRAAGLAALCALALAACGGHTDTSTTSTDSGTTNGSMGGHMNGNNMGADMTATPARVPRTLKCAGDAVVWANPRRKTFHMRGDAYYGRTKHGMYLCEANARAQGYHMAGQHKGAMNGNAMNGDEAPATP